jgi:O-antigen ligase
VSLAKKWVTSGAKVLTVQSSQPHVPAKSRIIVPRSINLQSLEHGLLYLGVALCPFALVRFGELFFTLSDFIFCISLGLLIISGRIRAMPLAEATPIWLLGFLMLFSGVMLGSALNGDVVRGLIVSGQYLFAYMALLLLIVRSNSEVMHKLALVFVFTILVVDIHGILTFYFVGYVPTTGKSIVTGGKRLATALRNPNLAASINALTLPLLYYLWSAGRIRTITAIPMLVVISTTVVLTSSNSGLASNLICSAVFALIVMNGKLMLRLMLATALVVVTFMSVGGTEILPKTFQNRVLSAFVTGDISEAGTFESRTELMKEAVSMISDRGIVVFGLGADQFREYSVQNAPVHNLYLLLWVEGGIVTLAGWLMFSIAGAQIGLALWRLRAARPVIALIASIVVTFLFIAAFNAHMYARYWTVPLLITYGLGLTHIRHLRGLRKAQRVQ